MIGVRLPASTLDQQIAKMEEKLQLPTGAQIKDMAKEKQVSPYNSDFIKSTTNIYKSLMSFKSNDNKLLQTPTDIKSSELSHSDFSYPMTDVSLLPNVGTPWTNGFEAETVTPEYLLDDDAFGNSVLDELEQLQKIDTIRVANLHRYPAGS